jgi:hypothetical protein
LKLGLSWDVIPKCQLLRRQIESYRLPFVRRKSQTPKFAGSNQPASKSIVITLAPSAVAVPSQNGAGVGAMQRPVPAETISGNA